MRTRLSAISASSCKPSAIFRSFKIRILRELITDASDIRKVHQIRRRTCKKPMHVMKRVGAILQVRSNTSQGQIIDISYSDLPHGEHGVVRSLPK